MAFLRAQSPSSRSALVRLFQLVIYLMLAGSLGELAVAPIQISAQAKPASHAFKGKVVSVDAPSPDQVARVRHIVATTPSHRDGGIHPAILYALHLCGAHTVLAAELVVAVVRLDQEGGLLGANLAVAVHINSSEERAVVRAHRSY